MPDNEPSKSLQGKSLHNGGYKPITEGYKPKVNTNNALKPPKGGTGESKPSSSQPKQKS